MCLSHADDRFLAADGEVTEVTDKWIKAQKDAYMKSLQDADKSDTEKEKMIDAAKKKIKEGYTAVKRGGKWVWSTVSDEKKRGKT